MAARIHILSEVNEATMTAVCRECGPVGLYRKSRGLNRPPRLQCLTKRREDRLRWDPPGFGRSLGLTARQIRKILEQQDHCEICGSAENLVLDHCHESGQMRGVLCRTCNRRLGPIERKGEWLTLALAYLKGSDCPCQHCSRALTRDYNVER